MLEIKPKDELTQRDIQLEIKKEKLIKKKKSTRGSCIKKLLFFGFVILILVILWKKYSYNAFHELIEYLHKAVDSRSIYSYAFFIAVECFYSIVIFPGAAYFDIALGFFMKEFWEPFWIIFLSSYLSSQVVFLASRYFFKDYLERKFKKNTLFKAIKIEVKRSPWKVSFFVNLIFLPMAIKNLLFPLTGMSYLQFCLPSLPLIALYDFLLVFVGLKIKEIKDIFEPNKFGKMSQGEKIEMIASWVGVVLTVIVMAVIVRTLMKRVKIIKELEGLEEPDDPREDRVYDEEDQDELMGENMVL